jgi:ribosome maturation factor RimP
MAGCFQGKEQERWGLTVPFIIGRNMIDATSLKQWIEEHFEATELFLVAFSVSAELQLEVFIDGDQGVTVADCIALTKALEEHLDRETEDFSLEVSSYGVGKPLLLPRQYVKNTGRLLETHQTDGTVLTGRILRADAKEVELELIPENKRGRIIKPEVPQLTLAYEQITKAIIQIEF